MGAKYPRDAWVVEVRGKHTLVWSKTWLTHHAGVDWRGKITEAKIFRSKQEAYEYIEEHHRDKRVHWKFVRVLLSEGERRKVYLYRIRRVAKEVLHLRMNTPWYLLRDAFTDAGMAEEAECLTRTFNRPGDQPDMTGGKK